MTTQRVEVKDNFGDTLIVSCDDTSVYIDTPVGTDDFAFNQDKARDLGYALLAMTGDFVPTSGMSDESRVLVAKQIRDMVAARSFNYAELLVIANQIEPH